MATFQVRALYDFSGQPDTAELSISAGEILTVTRTNVGEGWWEGLNINGESGLFPEAYCEKIEGYKPPSIPAPVLSSTSQQQHSTSQDDDWDDEWDNDDNYSEIGNNVNSKTENYYNEPNQNRSTFSSQPDNVSESNFGSNENNKGTISKRSLNRFSSYVKSGLESYLLGAIKDSGIKKVTIYRENDDNIIARWEINPNTYTVQVTSPKKASKMGGLKSFIAYQLTPSFSGVEVSRRYKHFDWLHDRLCDKFNTIAIPPLPDKQVSGRYEEHFIEHRRAQLQEFVNYMCRHPILSSCEVWLHFLTCTDEKQWKQGKRNAEKDQYVGANFCVSIEAPDKELLPSVVEPRIEDAMNYINKMDQCTKNLMQTAMDQQKKCVTMYKREFTRVGECFFALGSAFEAAQQGMYSKASTDVKSIGSTYMVIGKMYEEQAKIDWQPLADKLYIYKGITGSLPDILSLQKSSEQKKKDYEKSVPTQAALIDVRRRADVLTYAAFAELNHFQSERDGELKFAMKTFVQEQLNFYRNIVAKFEEVLNQFD